MLDFSGFRSGDQMLAELAVGVTHADLRALTNEVVDAMRAELADLRDGDVLFIPEDSEASDLGAASPAEVHQGWTLAHVICHATASSEEGAAHGLTLARGVTLEGRSRYEVDWQTITTVAQLVARLEESRRMRLAMLDAWPDQPHLDNEVLLVPRFGNLNAISRFLLGVAHEEGHLYQVRNIVAQVRNTR